MSATTQLLQVFPLLLQLRNSDGSPLEDKPSWQRWSWCRSEEIEVCLRALNRKESATQILYHFAVYTGEGGRIPTILIQEGGGYRPLVHPRRWDIKRLQEEREKARQEAKIMTEFLVPSPWLSQVFRALKRGGHHLKRDSRSGRIIVADESDTIVTPW